MFGSCVLITPLTISALRRGARRAVERKRQDDRNDGCKSEIDLLCHD
jgi:hypothetical protein